MPYETKISPEVPQNPDITHTGTSEQDQESPSAGQDTPPLVNENNHGSPPKRFCQDVPTAALHNCYDESIPTVHILQEKLNKSEKKVEELKKKLKVSQQRSRRFQKKVFSLKEIIKELKDKDLISTNCENMLNQTFEGVPLALAKRMKSTKKSGKGRMYSPEIKSFALTLQFYSAKAYSFVRKTFNLALPSHSQIRRWYSKIPADPGFTRPSFNALKLKVEEAKKKGNEVLCSLMLDEMAIKKHVSWDGKKYRGYVDIGNGADDDTLPVAKDALVFMVVGVNASWKVPCGYFFVDGLSGKERANLVKMCIQRLHDIGVRVTSLTCDGPSCHVCMLKELGVSLDLSNMVTYFIHPQDPDVKVYVFLDICHMLKLVRNTFGQWGILLDKDGRKIQWQYLIELYKLQESEGLRLANKLKKVHICWKQQKMKVNLAAQALSASVADALEYCANELKMPQFQGCEATVEFIRKFNQLFDILNSRNPLAKGYKAPLRPSNKCTWDAFLTDAYDYIIHLSNTSGIQMCKTKRKTGFLGFLIGIKSVKQMFHDLVESQSAPLKYLLTYKMSQDHLELFFCAVRACGGFNNNPTTQQFTAAYKRLLLRSHIEGKNGNCEKQDPTDILSVIGDSCNVNGKEITISNAALIKKYDLAEETHSNEDYSDSPNISTISEYKQAAISYIAGYVAKKVQKSTICPECSMALGSESAESASSFLTLKDRGNLFKASPSVITVCQETEKCFQRMLATTEGELPLTSGIQEAFVMAVLSYLPIKNLLKDLDDHLFDSTPGENHVVQLIKAIIRTYCKVKFYDLGKRNTENLSGKKIRKNLNKLVLFQHQ